MTVNEQFFSIVIMTISGIVIGAVIDATRVYISALSPKSFLRRLSFIIEIAIWILLGIATFFIIFLIKGGEWRLVDPLAQILGIFLYESFFQPFFRFLGRIIIILFIKPVITMIYLIIHILKRIIGLVFIILRVILKPFYKLFIILEKFLHRKFINIKRVIFKK